MRQGCLWCQVNCKEVVQVCLYFLPQIVWDWNHYGEVPFKCSFRSKYFTGFDLSLGKEERTCARWSFQSRVFMTKDFGLLLPPVHLLVCHGFGLIPWEDSVLSLTPVRHYLSFIACLILLRVGKECNCNIFSGGNVKREDVVKFMQDTD